VTCLDTVLRHADLACAVAVVPLAAWILISGIDDAVIDFIWIFRVRKLRAKAPGGPVPDKLTAIFVPLWNEHDVIRQMVQHNLAAIAYRNYHFFIGAYPNDAATVEVVTALEREYGRVHLVVCPHDGPTSKADCLNWIYQGLLLFEEDRGVRFETVIIHDAEDLIHSQALGAMNRLLDSYDTVQVPVFALPTPITALTHGVYGDEFAEYQSRDMPVRQYLGAFVPSCGVGTGYRRDALERLAVADANRIFDPASLTEDYENGLRLHELGCAQAFLAPEPLDGGPLATREFFPQTYSAAVRQRSRWLIGNVLQNWERHGWRGSIMQRYWFWRDRKGLVGSLLTAVTNIIAVYCVARTAAGHEVTSALPWPELARLATLLLVWRLGVRTWFTSRLYGWRFALGVPVRMLHGNAINATAAATAVITYARAKWRREPLRWVKTEHAYPNRAALEEHKRDLVEILTTSSCVSFERLAAALDDIPEEGSLAEHLLSSGCISEQDLAKAISLRENLPLANVTALHQCGPTVRSLPARAVLRWRVVPFGVQEGTLHVAGPEPPNEDMHADLRRFTTLKIQFHLTTETEFASALARVLPRTFLPENAQSSGIISSGAFLRSR
jgi:adsorption protein B